MGAVQSSYRQYMSVEESTPPSNVSLEKLSPPRKLLPVDPRSPSEEITRTPIVVEKTPDLLFDPRSPTPGVVRTPLFGFLKNIHIKRSSNSSLSPLTKTSSSETSPETISALENSITSDLSLIENLSVLDDDAVLISSPVTVEPANDTGDNPSKSTTTKPKQLFTNNRSGRSPLKVFNYPPNTPTRQVQRRQKRKVDSNIKSCRLQDASSTDKENVQH